MIEIMDQRHIRVTCDVCDFETTKEIGFQISADSKIVTTYNDSLHACQDCIDSGKAQAYTKGYEAAQREFTNEN
jgi:ribosomal protein L37AE/L43A